MSLKSIKIFLHETLPRVRRADREVFYLILDDIVLVRTSETDGSLLLMLLFGHAFLFHWWRKITVAVLVFAILKLLLFLQSWWVILRESTSLKATAGSIECAKKPKNIFSRHGVRAVDVIQGVPRVGMALSRRVRVGTLSSGYVVPPILNYCRGG